MRADEFGDGAFDDFERHVDLRAGDVFIFNFGFRQRGFFHRGPHDRFGPAIKLAGFGEFHQLRNDGRFRREIHGEIGIIPIPIDAEPFELLTLNIDPILRISAAFGAEFLNRHLILVQLFLAIFLFHLPFDGQAMAIPAGHIGRVFAEQSLGADHHIFQDMVERMADMHIPVRIRRAIMQDEFFTPRPRRAGLRVHVRRLPFGEDGRLLLRQASLHGEISLRQEDGVFKVAWFGHAPAICEERVKRNTNGL